MVPGNADNCVCTCSVGSETKVSLYQLIFADKIPSSRQSAALYHHLQSCILRLEYPLTSTLSAPSSRTSVGSYLLNCFTVQLYHQVRGLEESSEGPSKCNVAITSMHRQVILIVLS